MSTRSSKVFCPLRDMDMVPLEKLVFLKIFVNSIFFHKLGISEKFGFILFNLLITIITSIWDGNIYTIYSMKCWKVCIIVKINQRKIGVTLTAWLTKILNKCYKYVFIHDWHKSWRPGIFSSIPIPRILI